MTELLTAAQMRAVEQAAIDAGEVTGLELMERAGRGVVEAVFEEWPELAKTSHRAVVLCGPGNNGGDGFVVARLLKEWGWEVEVFLYGDPEKLPPDARVNYERWAQIGEVEPLAGLVEVTSREPALVVDAIFGTGLTRPIEDLFDLFLDLNEETLRAINMRFANCRLTAVDIPSGLCSDSGHIIGSVKGTKDEKWWRPSCLMGQLTVTFHQPKVGHHLSYGSFYTGSLRVKDIGLKGGSRPRVGTVGGCPAVAGEVLTLNEYPSGLVGSKASTRHKFSHGHALVLSGCIARTGAARLAARGALRIGAGLVTLGVPEGAQMEVASQVTAVMLTQAGTPDEVASVLQDGRINAVCLGPGLGLERARGLVEVVLGGVEPRPTVLDADALTVFAEEPEALFGLLHEECVLTPHGGEFARLFPDIAEKLNAVPMKGPAYSKVDATRDAAKRAGCVVLFKGPDTVIANPKGVCAINSAQYERAAPWLATAGSGDVLAGFITGLLARGFSAMQAAETGAWLHVECARAFGPGLIAEDLPEELPGVFRDLGV